MSLIVHRRKKTRKRHALKKRRIVVTRLGPAAIARREGRKLGFKKGFDEGYLRGRADVIVNTVQDPVPFRNIRILYVTTGKGFPYSPIDEAVISTLQGMVSELIPTDPRQPVADLASQVRPDLVLSLDGMEFSTEQVQSIRQLGFRTAIWLTDDPYYTDFTSNMVGHYDYVFTLELNCVPYYQSLGCPNVYYLPFAVQPTQYRPKPTQSTIRSDISFVGSAYWNRVGFFDQLVPYLQDKNVSISGLWWDRLAGFETLKDKIELGKWMGPQETSEVYNGSKIVINLHRSHDDDSVNNNTNKIHPVSPNPRTFEISSCATLQLTDIRDDLARFYTPGVEIETYASPQELMEKIDYYLANEEARRDIALRGLARTMREHTYARRLNEMLAHIFG
ncbi:MULTISPECIES: glycosyltransferase [unclassified Paenibacillus]|uniref:CgeB family protein n=1 Tax=unclassified Paenibacillus TaxID=185978 RepID=UPI001C119464|nr:MULTISPECIES: glycosyltransferase [unclassified Paenibacillus]MBU5440834.1 glycosyltransferase [Paenibacillus sp. MSJ-34]CAH0118469.1 hypothetical protein PAE9249_00958 [Paenibacillus sp. CECT 9249]